MIEVFINTIAFIIILYLVMKKEVNDNPGLLIAMPLGLSIVVLIFKLLMEDYYFVPVFIITAAALRLAFNTELWRITFATAICVCWIILLPHLLIYLFSGRWG